MTISENRLLDKLQAARHEGGHVTYGEAKGTPVRARLYKNPVVPKTVAEHRHRKYWLGQAYYRPTEFTRLSKLQKAAFGLAGAIAQDKSEDAEEVMDCWSCYNWSETDLLYLPPKWENRRSSCKFVLAAVEEAIAVLKSHDARLEEIVNILVREEIY